MHKYKVPRSLSSISIIVFLVSIIGYLFFSIIPLIFEKIKAFVVPVIENDKILKSAIADIIQEYKPILGENMTAHIESFASNMLGANINSYVENFIKKIYQSGTAFFTIITILIPCPLIIFYMLKDWRKMVNSIRSVIPKRHLIDFDSISSSIGNNISLYLKGQLQVCLFLSIFYAVPFLIIGLKSAIFISIIIGFMAFIPYIGPVISAIMLIIMSAIQYSDPSKVLLAMGILITGQILEGNFITPKIIGSKIEIHPTFIIFGLFTSVILFGWFGAVFALPITVTASVVVKFVLDKYLSSSFFLKKND